MAVCRSGKKVKTKMGFVVYGEQGTRKSSFCLESLKLKNEQGKPFKVLYIDAEAGSIDSYLDRYEDEGCDLQNIYIVYTQSIAEVKEFVRRAKEGDDFYTYDEETGEETDEVYLDAEGNPFRPDMIVVDGVTLLYIAKQQSMLEFSKKRATVRATNKELTGLAKEVAVDGASIEIKDYHTLKFSGQDLILDLLASGKHFAVTMRETDEKESFKDSNGEIKSMATGRKQPDGFKDVRYNCKTVLRLFKDVDGVIKGIIENKDRTTVFEQDTIIVEPSILEWQQVIDKNKDKKDFKLNNTLNESVKIERELIEKENSKFEEELTQSTDKTSNGELNSIDEYKDAIKDTIAKLSQTDKAKKQTLITGAGLPKAYQKIDNLEELKKYYSIVSTK